MDPSYPSFFQFFIFLLVPSSCNKLLLLEDRRQGGECDKPPLDQFVIDEGTQLRA
jgi:hypothetical protein